MSDQSVHEALRSDVSLVVVEAPGGCGKTFQGSEYAKDLAASMKPGRMLILTHTHGACGVFDGKTKGAGSGIEIRTIDSLISQIGSAYHKGIGVGEDAGAWARQKGDEGYRLLAVKVARLLERYPGIAKGLAARYPLIVCDEHQDCSGEQHAIIMAIHVAGADLRVFADPMQKIFKDKDKDKDKSVVGGFLPLDWDALKNSAGRFEELDTPHRWKDGDPELGAWILKARMALKMGGKVDLVNHPKSVQVVKADSISKKYGEFQLSYKDRKPVDAFVDGNASLLVLAHHTKTVDSLRGFFSRRIPLWEGHTRPGLERLVDVLSEPRPATMLAAAVGMFMDDVGVGFTKPFKEALVAEVGSGCATKRKADSKPARIQEIARFIVDEPDYRGVSKALRHLGELVKTAKGFKGEIKIDNMKEFWEAARMADYPTLLEAFDGITHKRTYSRPKPPAKAITTIHKAKGLECGAVLLVGCDAAQFPDTPEGRALLYVALSRATTKLMIVLPRTKASPLLRA